MKVNLILELKDSFKEALQDAALVPDSLFRRCVRNWQEHFDLDEMHLAPILQESLKNKISGRLWGGEVHSIKSSLLSLAKTNPDLFWTAIKDLLNEERMLIMRANRFIHHCDMIFQEIKKRDLKANTHRQDYYSASLLLSLNNPSTYCLFDFPMFEKYCRKIEVNVLPVNTDLERYYKIIKASYSIISKDEELMMLYYSGLEEGVIRSKARLPFDCLPLFD